ncbi:MAG: hypothetical protein E7052_11195 [Lentisphaerae bacterium]|nr:hypothetical protein [Lentisphaerota bacterium]
MKLILPLLLALPLLTTGADFTINGVKFYYRIPQKHSADSQIMVLFGGRNWPGNRTLQIYNFDCLADKHQLFLLAPSFKDRDYWEPGKWSGKLLQKAIRQLEKRYKLHPQKVYFYGYSAGGQCVALFYQWMPRKVAACGIHACGVYPEKINFSQAPFLITCGTEDKERFQISRHFIYRYREHGGLLLWKYFPNSCHELSKEASELAKVWFDDLLSGKKVIAYGEDDTRQIKQRIDTEFRNPLYSEKMRELWKK